MELMHIFWLILLVGVGLMILRGAASMRGGAPEVADSAEEIVRRRYAKGEINRDEYERLLRDLQR